MSCQNCNQGKNCPVRKQLEEEYSLKHDILLAGLVLVLSISLTVLMAFFM